VYFVAVEGLPCFFSAVLLIWEQRSAAMENPALVIEQSELPY
jgi:hypothetical protein